jgi:release factor glutamine methyltransferase
VDISQEALSLAKENAARLSAELQFHLADLLPDSDLRWNAILANLPYIPSAEIPGLSREVKHDPHTALDGGPDGLDLIRKLIEKMPVALHPGGLLALEIGSGQHEALTPLLQANNFRDIEALADYQGHIRFLIAKYG